MEDFLVKYGLFAVLFGSTVEADAMPVMAGVVAHLGYFNVAAAGAAAIGGMFLGDCVWYWLGRRFGQRIEKTAFYRKHSPKAERYIGKFGVWQILAARLVFGTRNATMTFWGIRKMNFLKFAAIDFAGCAVWGTMLVAAGYFLSSSANKIIGEVRQLEFFLLGILIIVIGFFVVIRYASNRRKLRKI